MLKRKMETTLAQWKAEKKHTPLIIKGCRQCGKSFIVEKFGRENYEHVILLDFVKDSSYSAIFEGSLDVDHLTMLMSANIGTRASFVPGKTLIVFDEIQECPNARTALKYFALDGRYDVIGTGSLLGVHGYGKKNLPRSVPIGYEQIEEMYPLDFEEFLWANGIDENTFRYLNECFQAETPVPNALHERLRELLLQYVVVGGMPEVVEAFVETKQLNTVLAIQRRIIRSYKDDMVKYAGDEDKVKIKECFESIPRQLSKENKKFQYSIVRKNARASEYISCLQWIEDAGIIRRCYNLSIPELPLDGNAESDKFKVYMADTGLFVSMLEDGTQWDILQGNLYTYKGAIYENLIADFLGKMGRRLYYYHKDSGLELNFIIRRNGSAVPIEVKATNGNAKSLRTVLNHPEKYHVKEALKIIDGNIGRDGKVLSIPHYLTFLLQI